MVEKSSNPKQPLPAEVTDKIRDLCQQGYQSFDSEDHKTAIRHFFSAWTLLPKPQTQWQEAGWVLTALGDAYFAKSDFQNGEQALLSALHCPDAKGNPIIHLRLGQCLYELGNTEAARLQFQHAIDSGGKALFEREDEKYIRAMEASTTG